MVLELSNEFLDKLIDFSFKYAKHRGSETLDPEDVKFAYGKSNDFLFGIFLFFS